MDTKALNGVFTLGMVGLVIAVLFLCAASSFPSFLVAYLFMSGAFFGEAVCILTLYLSLKVHVNSREKQLKSMLKLMEDLHNH